MEILISNIKKYALKFSIIGVLNTLIHLAIFAVITQFASVVVAQVVAFIIASVFSYFANTRVTYQQEAEVKTFTWVVVVYVVRLGLNALLAYAFEQVLISLSLSQFELLIPIMITAVLLPLQFIAFNVIFGVNKAQTVEQE